MDDLEPFQGRIVTDKRTGQDIIIEDIQSDVAVCSFIQDIVEQTLVPNQSEVRNLTRTGRFKIADNSEKSKVIACDRLDDDLDC
ncbi:hypothetical protein [Halorubrum sp. C191]|uniref:hypothetical protein n=1 Tax=Halorubrum sp. C191 TaxID=1383842 RepID=UPI00118194E0|nr:hypothetical protein [Halorubrum sp. C191]